MSALFRRIRDYRRETEVGGFLLVFFLCLSVFLPVYLVLRSTAVFDPVLEVNAITASWALDTLGTSTDTSGVTVSSPAFSFRIIPECTSVLFTGIFISSVLAWPATARQKLLGITFGVIALFSLNLIRVVSLYYIGCSIPGLLDTAHLFLWQGGMVLLTLILWLLWVRTIGNASRASAEALSSG